MATEVAESVPIIPNGNADSAEVEEPGVGNEDLGNSPPPQDKTDQDPGSDSSPAKEVPSATKSAESSPAKSEDAAAVIPEPPTENEDKEEAPETVAEEEKNDENVTANERPNQDSAEETEEPMEEGDDSANNSESKQEDEEESKTQDKTDTSADAEEEKKEEDASVAEPAKKKEDEMSVAEPAKSPSKTPKAKSTPKTPKPPPKERPQPEREGKRVRTSVQRFSADSFSTPKEIVLPEGSGTKLGDIPYVDHMIESGDIEVLKKLHSLMGLGRVGQPKEIRTNLRKFNGFDYEKESAKFVATRKKMEKGWVVKQMNTACDILGIPRGKGKEELMDVVLKFLLLPKDHGKEVPQEPAKKASKRKSKGAKSGRSRKAGGGKAKKPSKGSDSEEDKSESEEDEEEAPPPKKSRASSSSPKKSAASSSPAKGPSKGDITKVVKDILKKVNLEEVTMKEMCKKVYAKFPNHDMSSKKDLIKSTVKELISGE